MAIYEGTRVEPLKCEVTVDGKLLDPRLDLWNHSPTGFEWGYGGSGPAQLALAILSHHLVDGERAVQLHQKFKWLVVSELPHSGWVLTSQEIDSAVKGIIAGKF